MGGSLRVFIQICISALQGKINIDTKKPVTVAMFQQKDKLTWVRQSNRKREILKGRYGRLSDAIFDHHRSCHESEYIAILTKDPISENSML